MSAKNDKKLRKELKATIPETMQVELEKISANFETIGHNQKVLDQNFELLGAVVNLVIDRVKQLDKHLDIDTLALTKAAKEEDETD